MMMTMMLLPLPSKHTFIDINLPSTLPSLSTKLLQFVSTVFVKLYISIVGWQFIVYIPIIICIGLSVV